VNPELKARNRAEVVDEVSKWTVGLGIVIVALFPLSIPILVLSAAALVPLVIPVVAIGLIAASIFLVRALVRRIRRRRPTDLPAGRVAIEGETR
jgi:hypothetical protein